MATPTQSPAWRSMQQRVAELRALRVKAEQKYVERAPEAEAAAVLAEELQGEVQMLWGWVENLGQQADELETWLAASSGQEHPPLSLFQLPTLAWLRDDSTQADTHRQDQESSPSCRTPDSTSKTLTFDLPGRQQLASPTPMPCLSPLPVISSPTRHATPQQDVHTCSLLAEGTSVHSDPCSSSGTTQPGQNTQPGPDDTFDVATQYDVTESVAVTNRIEATTQTEGVGIMTQHHAEVQAQLGVSEQATQHAEQPPVLVHTGVQATVDTATASTEASRDVTHVSTQAGSETSHVGTQATATVDTIDSGAQATCDQADAAAQVAPETADSIAQVSPEVAAMVTQTSLLQESVSDSVNDGSMQGVTAALLGCSGGGGWGTGSVRSSVDWGSCGGGGGGSLRGSVDWGAGSSVGAAAPGGAAGGPRTLAGKLQQALVDAAQERSKARRLEMEVRQLQSKLTALEAALSQAGQRTYSNSSGCQPGAVQVQYSFRSASCQLPHVSPSHPLQEDPLALITASTAQEGCVHRGVQGSVGSPAGSSPGASTRGGGGEGSESVAGSEVELVSIVCHQASPRTCPGPPATLGPLAAAVLETDVGGRPGCDQLSMPVWSEVPSKGLMQGLTVKDEHGPGEHSMQGAQASRPWV